MRADSKPIGAAIDVGATSAALLIADLATGDVLARATGVNRQNEYGDTALTRINHCLGPASLLGRLEEAVVNETIAPLLDDALRQAGVKRAELARVMVTGGTAMLHLLAGIDPSPMGMPPYVPAFLGGRVVPLGSLDFRWPDEPGNAFLASGGPGVRLLPSASAAIGSDLIAGAAACGLLAEPGPWLFVDMGTSTELLLRHGDRLLGAATTAGPAFEGVKLASGGSGASPGAIRRLRLDASSGGRIDCAVAGGEAPGCVSAAGYIDFLAEGVRLGFLTPLARYEAEHPICRRHVVGRLNCHAVCFGVAKKPGGEPILISESDLAFLLQAKAAVAAGVVTLLDRAGLAASDLGGVYLAGSCDTCLIDPVSAIGCGLLPGFEASQIKSVGRAALEGARAALLDPLAVERMERAAASVETVRLTDDAGYEDVYLDRLTLAVGVGS